MTGRLVGKRYITTDESSSLPSYVVIDGRASYEIAAGPLSATLSLTADNLLDETYSTIRFYPMPPRHFGFGLNLEWRKST
jgi:iron complex outermembrane receptor protein